MPRAMSKEELHMHVVTVMDAFLFDVVPHSPLAVEKLCAEADKKLREQLELPKKAQSLALPSLKLVIEFLKNHPEWQEPNVSSQAIALARAAEEALTATLSVYIISDLAN
jgi:hypothetical protein